MIHTLEKAAPVREIRLRAGIAAHGTAQSVVRDFEGGCLHLASRSFTQTSGCQFTLSLALLNTFLKAVVILHGPVGCGTCSIAHVGAMKSFKRLRSPGSEGLVFLSTNLSESDVIGGGERRLEEAIRYADREFRPELVMVAVGCVPSIIGDDVDAVADRLGGEISARVVPVHCAGFRSRVMATAYDDVYHGIITRVLPPGLPGTKDADAEEERLREAAGTRTVNIMNVTSLSRADELELVRLVNALDLEARIVVCYASGRGIRESLSSGLNVSVCGTHDDYFLRHVAEAYGVPYLIDTMPIGPRNTARWLRRIAGFFERGELAEAVIREEEAALEEAVAPFREGFRGKTAFLAGGELRVIVTAELLEYLGLSVAGMKGHHFDEFALPALEQLDGDGRVLLVATQQPFEHVNLVKRLSPDVFVGHAGGNNVTARLGIPVMPLFSNAYPYLAYLGAFEAARRLRRILSNGAFNRNLAARRPLPFRESWYARSPFAYIRPGVEARETGTGEAAAVGSGPPEAGSPGKAVTARAGGRGSASWAERGGADGVNSAAHGKSGVSGLSSGGGEACGRGSGPVAVPGRHTGKKSASRGVPGPCNGQGAAGGQGAAPAGAARMGKQTSSAPGRSGGGDASGRGAGPGAVPGKAPGTKRASSCARGSGNGRGGAGGQGASPAGAAGKGNGRIKGPAGGVKRAGTGKAVKRTASAGSRPSGCARSAGGARRR
ncbi:MAG: hypothetical protein LBT40_03170 [Deltaproteobacteria bacterium]|jgi:nitrogenase molybdenum-iron protein alpha chain|nr:hypothetical protein [Deltaproteobacteria bacterium]